MNSPQPIDLTVRRLTDEDRAYLVASALRMALDEYERGERAVLRVVKHERRQEPMWVEAARAALDEPRTTNE